MRDVMGCVHACLRMLFVCMCERGEIERGCVCRTGFVFLREMDIFAAVSVCTCSCVGVCMSDYMCVCVVRVRACLKSENSNKKSSEYLNNLILSYNNR